LRVVITKLGEHLIPKTKNAPKGITATTLLLFTLCLCSCLPERFRHEKYDCSGSQQNINTIVINKAKTGNYAKIVSPASETKANITQIDEQTAWLTHKNIQMKINRKTGTVTMVQGTNYIKLVCKKTVFKM
jgi:uncharacterized protein with ParB-like and HNH nuclease domain